MHLYCTNTLLKYTNATEEIIECNPMFAWSGHIMKVHKSSTVLFIHHKTCACMIVHKVKKEDLIDIKQLFKSTLIQFLQNNQIKEEIITNYCNSLDQLYLHSSYSKKMTSVLKEYSLLLQNLPLCDGYQAYASMYATHTYSKSNIFTTNFFVAFTDFYKEQCCFCTQYEIEVSFDVKVYKVKRRLWIPSFYNLDDLHYVIQKAFGWINSQPFSFYVCNQEYVNDAEGYYKDCNPCFKGNLNIVFSMKKTITYYYDPELQWTHKCKLIHIHNNAPGIFPKVIKEDDYVVLDDACDINEYHEQKQILGNPSDYRYRDTLQKLSQQKILSSSLRTSLDDYISRSLFPQKSTFDFDD